jgi:hypothetical protein
VSLLKSTLPQRKTMNKKTKTKTYKTYVLYSEVLYMHCHGLLESLVVADKVRFNLVRHRNKSAGMVALRDGFEKSWGASSIYGLFLFIRFVL